MSQIGDVESLMTFRAIVGRVSGGEGATVSAAQLQEVLRDTRLAPLRHQESDLGVACVQQLMDTRAQDKRGEDGTHTSQFNNIWSFYHGI